MDNSILRFNPDDIQNEILRFNPYDNKNEEIGDIEKEARINFFYEKKLFEPYDDTFYSDVIINLERVLSNKIVYIYGPSGNGKTTLLHHIFERDGDNILSENYHLACLNLIEYEGPDTDEVIIRSLERKLKDDFRKEDKQAILEKYISLYESKTNICENDNIRNIIYTFLIQYYKKNTFSYDAIITKKLKDFINDDDKYTMYLLLLLTINNLFRYSISENENPKKLILLIDNLDELSHFYIITRFNSLILDFYGLVQYFFAQNKKKINECFKIMVVCREINYALISSELQDRMQQMTKSHIVKTNLFSKRLQRRNKFLRDECDICKHISSICCFDEKFTLTRLFPMFNYDGRMLIEALININDKKRVDGIDYSLSGIESNQYETIFNISPDGARGVFLLAILKYLIDTELSKSRFQEVIDIDVKAVECNHFRTALTVLSKACNIPDKNEENHNNIFEGEDFFNQTIHSIDFNEFYKKIKELYHNDVAKLRKAIKSICSISFPNYEIFTLCYNTKLDRQEDDQNIKTLFEKYINKIIESDNNVEIKINPSGVIYSDFIFRHFEYFNILANRKKYFDKWDPEQSRKNVIPLFLPIEKKRTKKELEKFLHEIFEITTDVMMAADNTFCKNYCPSETRNCDKYLCSLDYAHPDSIIRKYIDNNFTINKTIYTTRVLSTHVQYIEEFRKYIILEDIYGNEFASVHKIIIDVLKNYCNYFLGEKIALIYTKEEDNKVIDYKKTINQKRVIDNKNKHRFDSIKKQIENIEKNISKKVISIDGIACPICESVNTSIERSTYGKKIYYIKLDTNKVKSYKIINLTENLPTSTYDVTDEHKQSIVVKLYSGKNKIMKFNNKGVLSIVDTITLP